MPDYTPYPFDHLHDLIYKAAGLLSLISTDPVTPYFSDSLQTLAYKLAKNCEGLLGGVSNFVSTPSSVTDFSMLPGGVAPSSGIYFATKDENTIWEIDKNDIQWKIINKHT